MKKRWIVIFAGVIGAVSFMGTPASAIRVKAGDQIYKSALQDTVPRHKKDTSSYPGKDTTRLTQLQPVI